MPKPELSRKEGDIVKQEVERTPRRLARRHFIGGGLATLALAGTGLGLAACGDDDGNGAATATASLAASGFAPGPKPEGTVASARDATLPPLQPSPLQVTYRATDVTLEIVFRTPEPRAKLTLRQT